MSGKSNKTQMVSFRLSNFAVEQIKKSLESPKVQDDTVGSFCRRVIEIHVRRHLKDTDRTKYPYIPRQDRSKFR